MFEYGQLLVVVSTSATAKTSQKAMPKGFCIRSYSGLYFPAFVMNTETSVFSPNAGKYGPE